MTIHLPPVFHKFHYYDSYFRLRIPFRLWLIMIYGIKPFVISAFFAVFGNKETEALEMLASPLFFPMGGMALLVIFAGKERVAGAVHWKRQLWHRSHLLLLIAFGASATLLFFLGLWPALYQGGKVPTAVGLFLVIDFLILIYLLLSPLMRDVFLDFPEKHDVEYWYLRIFTH